MNLNTGDINFSKQHDLTHGIALIGVLRVVKKSEKRKKKDKINTPKGER